MCATVLTDNGHTVKTWWYLVAKIYEVEHNDENDTCVHDELQLTLRFQPKGEQREKYNSCERKKKRKSKIDFSAVRVQYKSVKFRVILTNGRYENNVVIEFGRACKFKLKVESDVRFGTAVKGLFSTTCRYVFHDPLVDGHIVVELQSHNSAQ